MDVILDARPGGKPSFYPHYDGWDCEPEIEARNVAAWMGPLQEPEPPVMEVAG
jgi:hypothetical protein